MLLETLLITTCLYSRGVCNQESNAYMKSNPEFSKHLANYGTLLKAYSDKNLGSTITGTMLVIAYGITQRTYSMPLSRHFSLDVSIQREYEGHPQNFFGVGLHF